MRSENIKARHTFSDFYSARGLKSMWFTDVIGYRIGAVLAVAGERLRLGPNILSVCSLVFGIGSAIIASVIGYGSVFSGVILLVGGYVGYGFDCADGVLARVTGRGSTFGVLFDKTLDAIVGILMPCALGIGAFASVPEYLGGVFSVVSLSLLIAGRTGISVATWLKEAITTKLDRSAGDIREKSGLWHFKKVVGNFTSDELAYRTLLALAWSAGVFWEFAIVFGMGTALVALTYLVLVKRELDEVDKIAKCS